MMMMMMFITIIARLHRQKDTERQRKMMGRFTLCFFFSDNKLELESKQMVLLVIELELELESKRP